MFLPRSSPSGFKFSSRVPQDEGQVVLLTLFVLPVALNRQKFIILNLLMKPVCQDRRLFLSLILVLLLSFLRFIG